MTTRETTHTLVPKNPIRLPGDVNMSDEVAPITGSRDPAALQQVSQAYRAENSRRVRRNRRIAGVAATAVLGAGAAVVAKPVVHGVEAVGSAIAGAAHKSDGNNGHLAFPSSTEGLTEGAKPGEYKMVTITGQSAQLFAAENDPNNDAQDDVSNMTKYLGHTPVGGNIVPEINPEPSAPDPSAKTAGK